MSKWFVWIVAAAVVSAMAMSTSAAEKKAGGQRGGGPAVGFKKMDADGNGTVSCEEFVKARNPADDEAKKKMEAMFKKMDANGDGQLTAEELAEWQKNRPAKPKADAKTPTAGANQ